VVVFTDRALSKFVLTTLTNSASSALNLRASWPKSFFTLTRKIEPDKWESRGRSDLVFLFKKESSQVITRPLSEDLGAFEWTWGLKSFHNHVSCSECSASSSSDICEVIRLDCDLLLMDTVHVSSRVRTIAYRMYRTPVRYSIHYLCDVNNTSSSDSWCCFSLTPSSRSESEAGLKIE